MYNAADDDHRRERTTYRPLRIFLLGLVVVGAFGGGFLLARLLPESSGTLPAPAVCSYLEIMPQESPFTSGTSDPSGKKHEVFMATQKQLIVSPEVIANAVRSSELAGLDIIRSQADPEAWLRDSLRVEILEGTRLIRISVSGPEPAQQAEIVNAITRSYLVKVKTWTDEESREKIVCLEPVQRALNKELKDLKDRLRAEMKKGSDPLDLEDIREEIAVLKDTLKPVRNALNAIEFEAKQGTRVKLIVVATVKKAP
jgi:hypothetical protein